VQARFARCDVADSAALAAAFDAHWAAFGGMDVCVLNAGIEEKDCFLDTPDDAAWRRVVDIDLGHVIEGTRLYVRRLRAEKAPGVLLLTASSAGIFPVRGREVYAAAKGGVVHLTRSLAHLAPRHGIRVCAVCPRYTDTGMVQRMLQAHPETAQRMISVAGGTVMPISQVVDGMMECIVDSSNAGKCLHIAPGVERAYWRFAGDEAARDAQPAPPRVSAALAAWALPRVADAEVVQVWQLSPDFRAATRLVRAPLPALPLPPGKVLVRRLWAGVNASDVNFSSGRYFGGEAAAKAKLPFAAGFETVGVVRAREMAIAARLHVLTQAQYPFCLRRWPPAAMPPPAGRPAWRAGHSAMVVSLNTAWRMQRRCFPLVTRPPPRLWRSSHRASPPASRSSRRRSCVAGTQCSSQQPQAAPASSRCNSLQQPARAWWPPAAAPPRLHCCAAWAHTA
jgi:NAD(P)-dependent dehydrogenase (short-subunit alcohol dehydrogenase family)